MKSIKVEKAYPYVTAVILSLLWFFSDLSFPNGKEILSASLTIGAILVGFLATSKALMMTIDTPVMNRIRSTSYVGIFASYMGHAIWLCFSFCILAMVGFFVDTASKWFGTAWVLIAIASACAFIRVTVVMLKIIKHQSSM